MNATLHELQQWDREIVWHAFTQMKEYEPLLIERAHGCTLVDVDGRELLDGVSSLWCNVHGHRHPHLDDAICRQLGQVAHVTSLGMSNPTTIRLARRLLDIVPPGLNHVFFSSDGSCAIEVALKNGGLGMGLTLEALGNANAALAPIVFGKWMNISGSAIANYWREKPIIQEA